MRERNDAPPPGAGPRCRTRTDAAVTWTSGHAAELAGVAVPLIGGALLTPWLDLVSAVWAAVWAVNEIRLRRTTATARQVAVATRPAQPALTASAAPTGRATEDTDRKEAKA